MEIMFYLDMTVFVISCYESLNLVKVKSTISNNEFFVDRKFLKCNPQKQESSLTIVQLRGY